MSIIKSNLEFLGLKRFGGRFLLYILTFFLMSIVLSACNDNHPQEVDTPVSTSTTLVNNSNSKVIGSGTVKGVTSNSLEEVDWTKVITDLGCDNDDYGPKKGIEIDALQFGDVTGDGKDEAFVAASCRPVTSSWPQRLYVYDGASDPTKPRLMKILLDYKDGSDDRGIRNPFITFSGTTITITSKGYNPNASNADGATVQITDIFTWDGHDFVRGKRTILGKLNH